MCNFTEKLTEITQTYRLPGRRAMTVERIPAVEVTVEDETRIIFEGNTVHRLQYLATQVISKITPGNSIFILFDEELADYLKVKS